jgi:hypothetical protein
MGDDTLSSILDKLGFGAGIGATYLTTEKLAERQRELGQQAYDQATALGSDLAASAAGTFKPFTVSTGYGGGLTVGQEGISMNIPESQLADLKALGRGGFQQLAQATGPGSLQSEQARIQGMLLGQDIGTAQQDIFSNLQAMRAAEQERQRTALEERLFSQGRSGVSTAQYGGTPEQLAFEKAIQEQQSADALMARQQALAEQQQRAGLISQALGLGGQQQALQSELGLGAVQAAFIPQQQALSLLAGGSPFSELATRAGLQGVVAQGELGAAGLEGLLGGQAAAAATEQQFMQNFLGSIFGSPTGGSEVSLFTKALKKLLG